MDHERGREGREVGKRLMMCISTRWTNVGVATPVGYDRYSVLFDDV